MVQKISYLAFLMSLDIVVGNRAFIMVLDIYPGGGDISSYMDHLWWCNWRKKQKMREYLTSLQCCWWQGIHDRILKFTVGAEISPVVQTGLCSGIKEKMLLCFFLRCPSNASSVLLMETWHSWWIEFHPEGGDGPSYIDCLWWCKWKIET